MKSKIGATLQSPKWTKKMSPRTILQISNELLPDNQTYQKILGSWMLFCGEENTYSLVKHIKAKPSECNIKKYRKIIEQSIMNYKQVLKLCSFSKITKMQSKLGQSANYSIYP